MDGRDGMTAFLPLDSRIGRQGRDDSLTVGQFLIGSIQDTYTKRWRQEK